MYLFMICVHIHTHIFVSNIYICTYPNLHLSHTYISAHNTHTHKQFSIVHTNESGHVAESIILSHV